MVVNGALTTISRLYKQDLEQAYLLFSLPSSFQKRSSKILCEIYDNPPCWKVFSISFISVAGDELPVLIADQPPPEFLKQHWETWLPASFSPATVIHVDEGMKIDGIPIVTTGAFRDIPKAKHCMDPDELQRIQSKSCIPEIGVPCPRLMDQTNLQYPCVIKPDLGLSGNGIFKANNEDEMLSITNKHDWKSKIIYQEYIPDIKEVRSHLFYLTKSCEIIWLGTNNPVFENQFDWRSMRYDWNLQGEQRNIDYEEFVIPTANYLHQNGYFGVVNIEIIVSEVGRYLVDLNVRLGGETAHHLVAPHMASKGLTFSCLIETIENNKSPKEFVETVNRLNLAQQESCIMVELLAAKKTALNV